MAKKVVAVFGALCVFLVLSSMVVRTMMGLVLSPVVGKPEDLENLHPWVRWPLYAVTAVVALYVAGSAAKKVLRWGFGGRR